MKGVGIAENRAEHVRLAREKDYHAGGIVWKDDDGVELNIERSHAAKDHIRGPHGRLSEKGVRARYLKGGADEGRRPRLGRRLEPADYGGAFVSQGSVGLRPWPTRRGRTHLGRSLIVGEPLTTTELSVWLCALLAHEVDSVIGEGQFHYGVI